jgi:uncharacterized repeat protein (TIGR01451 family)
MFRKLVSNLPFSPSLINQLGFYAKRVKREEFTRKIGLIFTIMCVIVQTVTIASPAKPTLAASTNDIIFGGGDLKKTQDIYSKGCDSKGRCDIKAIMNAYGINATNLASATYENIYSSAENNYWSIGRAPRGYGGEVSKQIPGGPKIWARTLHGWSANRNWNAIRVNTSQGTRWILTECGNIVTKESKPATPPPDMKMEKTVSKSVVKKGEKFYFTLKATNIGGSTAKNVLLYDTSANHLELQPDGLGSDPLKNVMRWETHKRFDIGAGQSFTYRIYAIARADGTTLENTACADIFDVNIYNNCGKATVRVEAPPLVEKCPYNSALPKNDPKCKAPVEKCPYNSALPKNDPKCKAPVEKCPYNSALPKNDPKCKAPVEKCPYNSALPKNDPKCKAPVEKCPYNSALPKNDPKCKAPVEKCPYNSALPKNDPKCKAPVEKCPFDPSIPKTDGKCQFCPLEGKQNISINSPDCKPCDETKTGTDGKDISCLELHKSARNITQNITNANETKANAGDTIEYTLSVKNFSKQIRKGFVIEENMEDVLEYADIIDASGAIFTSKPIRMLSWKPVDIKPGETIKRTILIKVKSNIPSTPASSSDIHSNDMRMVNVYGDTVIIKLPTTPIKTIERTITRLPNTGIGTNIVITTTLLMASTYFYFRSKLIVKELGLVKQQFNYGAGV